MADVTIYQLPDLTPTTTSLIPVSDGTVTGKLTVSVVNSFVSGFPSGFIAMWYTTNPSYTLPAGWYLCNGSNGTPNMIDRFVVGAGSSYNPTNTGGSSDAIVVSHTHAATSSVSDPGHTHSYLRITQASSKGCSGIGVRYGVASTTGSSGTGISVSTSVDAAGSSGTNANLPPYYALCYIMKS